MIEFVDVYASYDADTPILKGVTCRIDDGDFVAFVGTNGAGKSTTMRLINGLLKPDAGQVLIDGVPTTQLSTSKLSRTVGFLFQNPDNQICCNSVRDELSFGFKAQGTFDAEAQTRIERIVDEFGFDADADPFLLNRGARQLLALASVVVLAPPVVVLDEPTTGLDYRECVKVMQMVGRLHEQGTTVIMVCHDMEVVSDYAKQVVVMADGRVLTQGATSQILRDASLLDSASLVPPQVVDISLGLVRAVPALAHSAIGTANTIDQMCEAVAAHVGMPYTGPRGQEGSPLAHTESEGGVA